MQVTSSDTCPWGTEEVPSLSDYPYDLGTHTRTITTSSAEAQTWFDRGLNWIFGYHHEEAMECFKKALATDATCAMAHWGLAYCIGPNYNKPWEAFQPDELLEALASARQWLTAADEGPASDVERAIIDALKARYSAEEPAEDLYEWSTDYAAAMRAVSAAFPDDDEVTTLFVEAMMNRTPWQMWDPRTGEPVEGADTYECRELLEGSLQRIKEAGPARHPGLLHLYIHLMEMSPTPEAALLAADDLRGLVPSAGHLEHMATHIDVLCGNYQDVVVGNTRGINADLVYWQNSGAMNFYSLYRTHNYHFKLYGAMFLGQFAPAMDAVESMHATIPGELVAFGPFANFLESYMSLKTHALVRFGRWQELIEEPLPADPDLYTVTTAMAWYGKGVAQAALKHHDEAAAAVDSFEAAVARVEPERMMHVVNCLDTLAIAREVLNGEVKYHKGDYDEAFDHLRKAVELEDALPYDEPWGWMMPSRHALGALLLEQGHVDEAAAAYEADLGLNDSVIRSNQHPDNVWALIGLHDCYTQMGREHDARFIKPRLDFALSRADQEIETSCFCSTKTAAAEADCCS
jgi:tetratricopeptide (TPR) repeat protein